VSRDDDGDGELEWYSDTSLALLKTTRITFASRPVKLRVIKSHSMESHTEDEVLHDFGKRIQRCYGCFIAYHLKDMYLGEDVTFFCDHCKDETMFHFDDFSKLLDISKLNEMTGEHHH